MGKVRASNPGCTFADVDLSKLESFMSKEDLALFEQSKAAISELKQNKELMDIYKESHTCHLEQNFKFSTALDGSHVSSWEKYAKKNRIDPYSMPYYNPNDPLIWLHKRL